MSKVVLLAINAKYVHTSLAVWALASGVREFAKSIHDVRIVEATINQSNDEIIKMVTYHSPDVVGISSYIWNAKKLPEILIGLREVLPNVKLILGGPEASFNVEYWRGKGANEVIIGEGEYAFAEMLDCYGQTANYKVYANNAHNQEYQPETCPLDPYTSEYLDALNGRLAYIETSRGCPFNCAFCLSAGDKVRFFSIEAIEKQILKLSKSKARTIKFVDRTFNCDAGRAYRIFKYILSLDTHCCFHFEVAADLFDEKAISLLKSAPPGRIQFEAGLQSFFEPTLKAATRKTSPQKAEKNICEIMHSGNIHMHVDLIAGLPYETFDEFKNSFDRAYALKAHTLQLGFLKLLHGSKIREQAGELGIIYSQEPPYEIKCSPWLSSGEIAMLKQAENALQHTANKSRFLSAIEYILGASGMRPFELFRAMGENVANHAVDLSEYAQRLFEFFETLSNVEHNKLRDHMVFDWLGMVKGKNMPGSLKSADKKRAQISSEAEKRLGRKIRRDETAILSTGQGICVDSEIRCPVTSLYKVSVIDVYDELTLP